jgi:hypothetical protein
MQYYALIESMMLNKSDNKNRACPPGAYHVAGDLYIVLAHYDCYNKIQLTDRLIVTEIYFL